MARTEKESLPFYLLTFLQTINRRIPEAWIRDRRWMVRTEVEEQPVISLMSLVVVFCGRGWSRSRNTSDFSDPLPSFILVYEILNAKQLTS